MSTLKRKGSEKDPAIDSLKKRRLSLSLIRSTASNSYHSNSQRFLPFHLRVLESLYAETNPLRAEDQPHLKGEDSLEAEIITLIEKFQQNQPRLLQAKREASRWQGIHQEALLLQCKNRNDEPKYPVHSIVSPQKSAAAMGRLGSCRLWSPLMAPYPSVMITGSQQIMENNHYESFQIISSLLGKRRKNIDGEFRKQTAPYQALLVAAKGRIKNLQAKLDAQTKSLDKARREIVDKLLSSSDSGEGDRGYEFVQIPQTERNSGSLTTCKIQLWTMLVHDLSKIMD